MTKKSQTISKNLKTKNRVIQIVLVSNWYIYTKSKFQRFIKILFNIMSLLALLFPGAGNLLRYCLQIVGFGRLHFRRSSWKITWNLDRHMLARKQLLRP